MPRGASEQAQETFQIWQVFFIAAIPVAGIVYVLIAWSIVRYRRRRSDPPGAQGSQRNENIPMEIVYTAVPVMIVVALFVLAIRTDDRVTAISPDPDLIVRVEAFAWGWRFTYPDGETVVSPPSGEDAAEPLPWKPQRTPIPPLARRLGRAAAATRLERE